MAAGEAIGLGLISALGWGSGDLLAKKGVDRSSFFTGAFALQWGGLFPVACAVALGWFTAPTTMAGCGLSLAVGIFGSIGLLSFYRAVSLGKLSVVAPLAAGWVAITVLLALVVGHEAPSRAELLGVSCIVVGTLLTVREGAPTPGQIHGPQAAHARRAGGRAATGTAAGAGWALLAALSWGVTFYLVQPVGQEQGPWAPMLWTRLTGTVTILLGARYLDVRPDRPPLLALPPDRRLVIILAAMVLLDTVAYLAYNLAVLRGLVTVVAPMASLSTAVAVGLALATLRERPTRAQLGGIAAIGVGIAFAAGGAFANII